MRRRAIILLGGAVFTLALGVNMHVSMNVNFLHDLLSASSWQQGYLEAIRETCGILSFFAVVLLTGRSEPRVAAVMLLLVGCGLAAYSRVTAIPQLILCSLVWSFGFHIWAPLSGSMQLGLAQKGREGRTLGVLGSVGSAGVLLALGGVYVLKVHAGFGMRQIFLVGGALTALGALPLLAMPEIRAGTFAPMPLRRALEPGYRLYCGLELLDGCRKQIFILFAVLTLVQEYGVKVENIAALMFVNQMLCLAAAPAAGWLVDRIGERPVLTIYFSVLVVVFLLYATVRSIHVLYGVFIVDSVIWTLKVAVPTYANRIVRGRERSQLLALGTTANHVGAVILPFVGGALYATWGYRFPFYCGAAIALVSLMVSQCVPARD
jgi:MFS family permease